MEDVAVKYQCEVTLILPPTSCSSAQSLEQFLAHGKKLQEKRGREGDELNFLLSHERFLPPQMNQHGITCHICDCVGLRYKASLW